jgi:hypothetical protein
MPNVSYKKIRYGQHLADASIFLPYYDTGIILLQHCRLQIYAYYCVMTRPCRLLSFLLVLSHGCYGLNPTLVPTQQRRTTSKAVAPTDPLDEDASSSSSSNSRRNFILGLSAASLWVSTPPPSGADTGAEVRGEAVTPFNGLAFQYRGSDYGGLQASELDEKSVSYADFMTALKAGEIEFVEFMAPDGDAAYATFRGKSPIRIGEGYPLEQHDGWSSPAFAIRAVKNAGVPYKFTVPALRAYQSS